MSFKTLPMPAQLAAYWAFRTVTCIPMVMSTPAVLRAARTVGRWIYAAPFSEKRAKRARDHLALAFPELSEEHRERLAKESFEHLALLAAELTLTSRLLTEQTWTRHMDFSGASNGFRYLVGREPVLLITGHCGNWEVLGYTLGMLGFPVHALYRPFDLKPLDAWVRRTRSRRGLELVDKFGAIGRLPGLVAQGRRIAFVADQNGGDRGVMVPFFGRLTSTYKSIGLLAIQSRATIIVGQARRLRPSEIQPDKRAHEIDHAKGFLFRGEVQDVFGPDDYMRQPDPLFYLTARFRRGIEGMVRRQPGDYFWMHRTWRCRPRHERDNKPFPERFKEKLLQLPWLSEADVEGLIEQSDRDRARLAELGTTRLP